MELLVFRKITVSGTVGNVFIVVHINFLNYSGSPYTFWYYWFSTKLRKFFQEYLVIIQHSFNPKVFNKIVSGCVFQPDETIFRFIPR